MPATGKEQTRPLKAGGHQLGQTSIIGVFKRQRCGLRKLHNFPVKQQGHA